MPKFKKKPVTVEAEQFKLGQTLPFGSGRPSPVSCSDGTFYIDTLEGRMIVSEGDWVIKGVKGEFYPCKPDIFEATYDRIV